MDIAADIVPYMKVPAADMSLAAYKQASSDNIWYWGTLSGTKAAEAVAGLNKHSNRGNPTPENTPDCSPVAANNYPRQCSLRAGC